MSRGSAQRNVVVELQSTDDEGMAVGTRDGRRVHVKGVAPAADGVRSVAVRILKRRRGQSWGIVETQTDSQAPCRHYPVCGGCAMQHLEPETQLALKAGVVLTHLARHGIDPDEVGAPVHGPQTRYRRRARLGVRFLHGRMETLVGFRESFSSRVARIDDCLILAPPLDRVFPALAACVATLEGRARIPQIEVSAGDSHGVVIVRHLDPLTARDRERLGEFEAASGLGVLVLPGGNETVARLDGRAIGALRYRLDAFDATLEFAPLDFVQVNGFVNRDLVAAAVGLVQGNYGQTVIELFGGIGNFTIPLARSGASVVSVEGSADLVDRARQNATRNGLATQIEALAADLYVSLDASLISRLESADVALVDPPRSGLGGLAPTLAGARLPRIVYVSCHPESFARDAAVLAESGYALRRLTLFDMFPHTVHVETLALFERR